MAGRRAQKGQISKRQNLGMRAVLQRVIKASVEISGHCHGQITHGWLVFLAIGVNDRKEDVAPLADKIIGLRLFADEQGKFNKSLQDVNGGMLIVSQFTLYADCSKGRRPSFAQSASPQVAKDLYEEFIIRVKETGINVATGEFGADMQVSLVNDGPVTIILDSKQSVQETYGS